MIIQFVLENFANREPIGLYYFSSQSSVSPNANANANATKFRSASASTSDDGIVPAKWNGIGERRNGYGNRDKNDPIQAMPIAIPNCNTYYYGQPEGRSDFAALILTGAGPDCGTDTGGGTGSGVGAGTGGDYGRGGERGGGGRGRGGLGSGTGSGRDLGRGGGGGTGAVTVAVGNAPLASHSTETAHLAYAGNYIALHCTVLYCIVLYCNTLYCTALHYVNLICILRIALHSTVLH